MSNRTEQYNTTLKGSIMQNLKQLFILKTLVITGLLSVTGLEARSAAGKFLKTGFGARAAGLGGTYTAIANDPSALYWNPAGLAQINGERKTIKKIDISEEAENVFEEDSEFAELMGETEEFQTDDVPVTESLEVVDHVFEMQLHTSGAVLSEDKYVAFLGTGFTALGGTIGAGALGNYIEAGRGYDATGAKTSELEYKSYAGYLGYGREMGAARFGVSAMGMQEDVGGRTVNGGGLNVGFQVVPIPILSAGATVQNLAGAVQTRSGTGTGYEKLDTIVRFAFAVSTPPPNSNIKFLTGFTTNLDNPEHEGMQVNLGLAYGINKYTYVMAGINDGRPAIGLGLSFKSVQMAYSYNRDILDRENQHYLDLNLVF